MSTPTPAPQSSAPAAAPRPERPSRLRRKALGTVTGLLAMAAAVHAASAGGGGLHGVNYVHTYANPTICGGALPCISPEGGVGKSNTLYVHQSIVDGEYRFTQVTGTGQDLDDAWFQIKYEGQCKLRNRLESAYLMPRLEDISGIGGQAIGEPDPTLQWPMMLPVDKSHRTIPMRNLAVNIPVDDVLAHLMVIPDVDLLAWGEERIGAAVEAGEDELSLRAAPATYTTGIGLGVTLTCRQISGASTGMISYQTDATWMPLEIVWLGVGMEPGDEEGNDWRDTTLPDPSPEPPAPLDAPLSIGFQVTQAHLSVLSDPVDPCTLHLSGVVTTTEPGTVKYRYADELGVLSQVFTVEVDQTRTAMFSREVTLEPTPAPVQPDGAPGDLTAGDDGQIGGFAAQPTDNHQGYYELRVVEPHALTSDVASYNVSGCVEEAPVADGLVIPATPLDEPTGEPNFEGPGDLVGGEDPVGPTPPAPTAPGDLVQPEEEEDPVDPVVVFPVFGELKG